jgi:hypothetical protein
MALGLPRDASMNMHTAADRLPQGSVTSTSLLRWVFRKGDKFITCELERGTTASSYGVCIVPHWDVASAIVEKTGMPIRAFCRHAEVARRLRAAGWSVIHRSA